jgi:hypothetical protein
VIGACLPERVRQFVRVVSAEPPYGPEPHPDEPFAPVYDYRPLGLDLGFGGELGHWVRPPRDPDRIVFGDLAAQPPHEPLGGRAPLGCETRWCARCDVRWGGDAARCWNCGRPG